MKLKGESLPVLDAQIEAELLEGLAAIEPPAARAQAMRESLAARMKGARAPAFITVHRGEGDWRVLAPRVAEKRLVDAPGIYACLIRMEKGAMLPPHGHPTPEECVVLEGEVWLGGVHCRAGDFHLAPAGLRHGALRTDAGCLLYVRTGDGQGVSLL